MPHWCVPEILFIVHPSGTKFVMNTIGFSFLSKKVKAVAKGVFGMSTKIVKTMLRLQFNAIVFPAYFFYGGVTYVYNKTFPSKKNNASSLEPKSDDVIGAVKNLRNSVLSGMRAIGSFRCDNQMNRVILNDSVGKDQENRTKHEGIPDLTMESCSTVGRIDTNPQIAHLGVSEVSGSDIMWDIPIISAKASYFVQCLNGKHEDDIVIAKKALEEHPVKSSVPGTRQEYNKMIEKARNIQNYSEKSFEKHYNEPRFLGECCANDNMYVGSSVSEQKSKQENIPINDFSLYSTKQKGKLTSNRLIPQNKIMCRELVDINKSLKKIRFTCSKLLEGLIHLNDSLAKVIAMREKLTSLEFQVDEGKKLLQVVETDRSIMKTKLTVLEKLITEEEKFLCGDASCESGFYESENVETTSEF